MLRVDPHDLVDLPVTATIVGGRVVHERAASTPATSAAATAGASTSGRGLTCLQDGRCCCRLADEIRAGQV